MKLHRMAGSLPSVTKFLAVALTLIFSAIGYTSELKSPTEATVSTALAPTGGLEFLLAVHPSVGTPNQPRTIFLQFRAPGCSGHTISLDTASMETKNLVVIRTQDLPVLCPLQPRDRAARFDLTFTPTKAGTLTMRWDRGGPDATIESLANIISSKFDINGMWFDPATNGSGIAFHHRRATTDVAFGTWFLFNNNGESRWYTLQSANWQQDGSVLEGLLIQVIGRCPATSLAACPALGFISFGLSPATAYGVIPSLARITFQSPTRARAEVLSLGGTVLFTSALTKLQF